MRSSKSRSRSKSNRNRSMGNIVNRVFDSSGPEGKVRGTPQQIIDKYNQLARDAQLANDRVAAENFQQHAEHYTRMLGEALREQQERQQQDQQQQERQQERHQQERQQQHERREQHQPREERQPQPESFQDDVIDDGESHAESGLVETPESAPQKPRRGRRPKKADAAEPAEGSDAPEAAE